MCEGGDFSLQKKLLILVLVLLVSSGATAFSIDDAADMVPENISEDVENVPMENFTEEGADVASDLANKTSETISETNFSDAAENLSVPEKENFFDDKSLDLEEIESKTSDMELDEGTIRRVKSNLKVATEKLPENDTERIEKTVEVANEICNDSPDMKVLRKSMNQLSEDKVDIKRVENAAGVLKDNFDINLNPKKFNDAYKSARDFSQFAPVIGSYGNLVNKSCAVERDDNESIKEFYQASAYFGAEIVLIEVGVTYKVSSKAVRYMNSKAGMARIRGICGDECYSFVLSEAHWLFRGTQEGMKDYLMYESEDLGKALEKDQVDKFMERNSEIFKKSIEKGQKITGAFVGSVQNSGFFSKLFSFFGL
jgi:hypothetical protein